MFILLLWTFFSIRRIVKSFILYTSNILGGRFCAELIRKVLRYRKSLFRSRNSISGSFKNSPEKEWKMKVHCVVSSLPSGGLLEKRLSGLVTDSHFSYKNKFIFHFLLTVSVRQKPLCNLNWIECRKSMAHCILVIGVHKVHCSESYPGAEAVAEIGSGCSKFIRRRRRLSATPALSAAAKIGSYRIQVIQYKKLQVQFKTFKR
jgi:hypothetical protein